ncbi:DUF5069 domain-containing protein [Roseibacillus persicicus]|uniref:DUF5069 domain-containing protein n=1 Tax=Roseibacillus persicicus TaxID=454148 RepID=UPI00398BB750
MKTQDTNLSIRPPRSPRVRLGGFVHLPRLIDKARAVSNDSAGDYVYGDGSLLDSEFFKLTGISSGEFLEEVSRGGGDWEVLQWVHENLSRPLAPFQIQSWSQWLETLPGLSLGARAWFAEYASNLTPAREDIGTLFEYLDIDDYVTFGGAA